MAKSVSPDRSEGCKISVPDDLIEPSPDDLLSDFTDYDYALYGVLDGGVDYIGQISAVRSLAYEAARRAPPERNCPSKLGRQPRSDVFLRTCR
jgi:hypothetical protein